jgi:RNA polymerase sigma-54 factor
MFQLHTQSIRPLTTAHLAQTMTLLSLTVDELRQQIDSELASNPALELVEERRCPTCKRILANVGACPVCSSPLNSGQEEPLVFVSPREDFFSKEPGLDRDSDFSDESYSTVVDDLPTYVLRQIAPDLEVEDRRLAAHFLTHLDDDGLIEEGCILELARYYHLPISRILEIQKIIQRADPIGVGSCSTKDAMLVQIEMLEDVCEIPDAVCMIIEDGMSLLSRHQYGELAKKYHKSTAVIQNAFQFITENLNPFPARSHWGDVRQPAPDTADVYHHPDIIIGHINEDEKLPLMVEIIMPISGTLQINPLFRKAMKQVDDSKKEEWKSDIERASLLVKCLQQRNHTIQRLMLEVVLRQKDAIINGDRHMQSLTRVELARELDVHESTISRAVAKKTVQLPNKKIVPLASFFDRSLNVRTVLCDLVANEPKPLSDSELSKMLAKEGFNVARRTVAKYRAMEGILPAHLRHNTV